MTIKLERLTKTYNPDSDFPVHAVQHVDLEIKQGEFVAIMGPLARVKQHCSICLAALMLQLQAALKSMGV